MNINSNSTTQVVAQRPIPSFFKTITTITRALHTSAFAMGPKKKGGKGGGGAAESAASKAPTD